MRIGIFDPYLDDLGGGEKYMISIASCLSKKNDVVVFWDNSEDLKNVSERFSLDISRVKLAKNIFSSRYSFFGRLIKSSKFDIIVVLSDGSIPLVLSKKLFIHLQQPFPNLKMSLNLILKKLRVSSFFCNSLFTKSFIDKEFNISSSVVYPPVDSNLKKGNKENIILHVGRFRAQNVGYDYKKQEVMVDIFKKMVDDGLKNWKLIIAVGLKSEDEERFRRLQEKTKRYPIEFMVNLNNGDLHKIYSIAKIYWHASGYGEDLDKKPELAEHFGISTVEAMGAGVVPVVINLGGQREIVEDGKNGYLWNTKQELIKKTIELTKDNLKLKRMSDEAMNRSKIFSKDRFCKDIESIFFK